MTPVKQPLRAVNLLDCEQEPSDAQLEQLMREVAADARARARVASRKFREDVAREAAAALERYAGRAPEGVRS